MNLAISRNQIYIRSEVLKLKKSWNKCMAIQSATSKEDKINLGFRIFFFLINGEKILRKQNT